MKKKAKIKNWKKNWKKTRKKPFFSVFFRFFSVFFQFFILGWNFFFEPNLKKSQKNWKKTEKNQKKGSINKKPKKTLSVSERGEWLQWHSEKMWINDHPKGSFFHLTCWLLSNLWRKIFQKNYKKTPKKSQTGNKNFHGPQSSFRGDEMFWLGI